jgi:uncharacterized membrane protein
LDNNKLRNRTNIELLIIITITLLLIIAVIFLPFVILRLVLGLLFALFLPGYALISALFPSRSQLSTIERITYSIALSIAIVALIGLLLNYIWSISVYPILISVSSISIILAIVAWLRRRNLPENTEVHSTSKINLSQTKTPAFHKILYIILTLVIIGAAVISVYVFNNSQEKYTEFYLLGPNGMAEDYPQSLTINQPGNIILIVTNHENEDTGYIIKFIPEDCIVLINGVEQYELDFSLVNNQQMSYQVTFTFKKPGDAKKLEFDLYKNNENIIYLSTYIKVKVNTEDLEIKAVIEELKII